MTNPKSITYKGFGDVQQEVIAYLLGEVRSPMLSAYQATSAAASPHSALFWSQAWLENKWETTGEIIKPEDHNPVSLRPWIGDPTASFNGDVIDWKTRKQVGSMLVPPGAMGVIRSSDGAYMLRFKDDAACVREWRRRLFDDPSYKGGVYRGVSTLSDMLAIYAPSGDVHPVTGVDNKDIGYAKAVMTMISKFGILEVTSSAPVVKDPPMSAVVKFGQVPFPGYLDHQESTANKPERVGWDNLGKRTPMFVVIHRMEGTLASTDGFFPMASTQALTDYGVGTANVDGAASDGVIIQWNDPRGYRAGWASGPVMSPYGDALRWINWSGNKWGVSICNVCGVSIENSGFYEARKDTMTDFAFGELVKLVAYWWDQMGIAWDKAPIHPLTGISALTLHIEWTYGSGKRCPGDWLSAQVDRLISEASAYMKTFQLGDATTPPVVLPPVVVPPPSKYPKPQVIPELVKFSVNDADTAAPSIMTSFGRAVWVNDTVEAIRDTKRYLDTKLETECGPVLKKGETAHVLFLIDTVDGKEVYASDWFTIFNAADFKRIKD